MKVQLNNHTVEYRDGQLVALDHGDVDAEQALAVLAGDATPCACIDLVLAWQHALQDPRTALVGPRSHDDVVHLDPEELDTLTDQVRAWRERMRGAGRLDPTVADFEKRLLERLRWLRLWTLPAEIQQRLREHAVGSGG